ncbi:MAG: shikimate kinase [Spirochaetes bacterium]|nr:shikimate kinase [Spirochaetota bacterium]
MPRPSVIALIGYRGSGKTTVGRIVAAREGLSFIDSDDVIREREQTTISGIFADKGESYFRTVESAVLADLLSRDNIVLSTGGGIIVSENNRRLLHENAFVVYLSCPVSILIERIAAGTDRPALLPGQSLTDEVTQLYTLRRPLYESCAHMTLDTGTLSAEDAATAIGKLL